MAKSIHKIIENKCDCNVLANNCVESEKNLTFEIVYVQKINQYFRKCIADGIK